MIIHTEDGAPVRTTNRLPVELYGATGQPLFSAARAAADAIAPPTAPDVLATLFVWDGTNMRLLKNGGTGSGVNALKATLDSQTISSADARSNSVTQLSSGGAGQATVPVRPEMYNESTWDRPRNNVDAVVLVSAQRTATTASADLVNHNGRGVRIALDVSAIGGGAPSLTLHLETKDPASGVYTATLSSAAIAATGHYVLRVYPGIAALANQAASDVLSRIWRVRVVHANADPITYSVGATTLL